MALLCSRRSGLDQMAAAQRAWEEQHAARTQAAAAARAARLEQVGKPNMQVRKPPGSVMDSAPLIAPSMCCHNFPEVQLQLQLCASANESMIINASWQICRSHLVVLACNANLSNFNFYKPQEQREREQYETLMKRMAERARRQLPDISNSRVLGDTVHALAHAGICFSVYVFAGG